MPFNQLLLPLLGGYLLITYAHCFVYWTSRHSKEQLLFASAFAGALLGITARTIVLLASKLPFGKHIYGMIHAVADYQGIGTAVLALALSVGMVLWINRAWPAKEAGTWLYGRGTLTELENIFFASILGIVPAPEATFRALPVELPRRLLASLPLIGPPVRRRIDGQQQWAVISTSDDDTGKINPVPIILSMKDRKVYVGILAKLPPLTVNGASYISLTPLMSGHRDKDSLEVTFTSDYERVLTGPDAVPTALPTTRVFPTSEIVSAGLFDVAVYARFQEFRDPQ